MVLEDLSRVPPDNKEIKPVNLQEVNPEHSMEELILKLKFRILAI